MVITEDDMLAPLVAVCESCGKAGDPAGWCPAWKLSLCQSCRMIRTETELRMARDAAELGLLQRAGITLWALSAR